MMINQLRYFGNTLLLMAVFLIFTIDAKDAYSNSFPDVTLSAQEYGEKTVRDGADLPIQALASVQDNSSAGTMTQFELLEALGRPQEGGEREDWYYVFNMAQSSTHEIACQFRVSFKNSLLKSSGWRRRQCADLFADEAGRLSREKSLLISFDFDSDRLLSREKEALQRFLEDTRASFGSAEYSVTGFADNIGAKQYNIQLSQRRAKAVMDEMLRLGVNSQSLAVSAGGSRQLLVSCEASNNPDAIACNSPNRRVSVKAFN